MWREVTIAEIAAHVPNAVNGGPFGSKLGRKDYTETGVPVIRGGNLGGDQRFESKGFVYVSEEKAKELHTNLARPGDIVVTQRGTLGQVGIVSGSANHDRFVISQSQMKLTVDEQVADRDFVYYSLTSPVAVRRMQDHAIRTGVPHINLDMFRKFTLDLPPLPVQRKIAAVLAAYDELIENNLRRIEILEEMAHAVYREWFVEFRFPGHENVPRVNSTLGPIPEGWSVSTLGQESLVVMGQSPKSEFYNDDGMGLPFHQGVTNFGDHFPRHRTYCIVESRVAEIGDTLVSVRAPVGRINVADRRLVIGRGIAAVRAQRFTGFHHRQLREIFREEDSMGGGTIYKAITKGDLLGLHWLVPGPGVAAAFDATERPMHRLVANLTSQSTNLRATRDLLLPKLVSGEIDVSDLDIDTEWLAS